MPNPTGSSMHQNAPLQNMTVAATQEDEDFILRQIGPFQGVDKKSDDYYVYDDGDWNRMEMQPRGPSEESHGSGWRLSTDDYRCDRWAVHKDFDWTDEANADDAVADTDGDAKEYLANQGRIYGDYLLSTNVFAAALWTDDYAGVSGSPGSNEIKQWDQAASDPQADFLTFDQNIKGRVGKRINTMIVGYAVHNALIINPTVRTALQGHTFTSIPTMEEKLAAFFGVPNYHVGSAFYNTAAETATKVLSFILGSTEVWMGYINPEVGKRKMTAFRTFAFNDGGRATDGMVVRTVEMPWLTTTRHEIETFWDVKLIAADAGSFVTDAVA